MSMLIDDKYDLYTFLGRISFIDLAFIVFFPHFFIPNDFSDMKKKNYKSEESNQKS